MKKGMVLILSMIAGAAVGAGIWEKTVGKKLDEMTKMSNKHLDLFLIMNQWVKVKQEGKNLASYFQKNGYKKIAVYGMSYAGETLVEELRETDIKVAYGIDKRANSLYMDIDLLTMDDELDEVDAVVVTAITFFNEIEEELVGKLSCPVISLEDILYDV